MDSEQEQQCSHAMRELARQYAEGRFNKEEYRNRRRELIGRYSGETPLLDSLKVHEPPPMREDPDRQRRVLRVAAIVCVSLLVLMVGAIIALNQ